jgi:hypothetical protein
MNIFPRVLNCIDSWKIGDGKFFARNWFGGPTKGFRQNEVIN